MPNMTGSIEAFIGADISKYEAAMSKVANLTKTAFSNAQKNAMTSSNKIVRTVANVMAKLSATTKGVGTKMASGITTGLNTAVGQVQRIAARIGEKIPDPIKRGFDQITSFASATVTTISNTLGKLVSVAGKTANGMMNAFNNGFNKMSSGAVSGLNKISNHFSKTNKSGSSLVGTVRQLTSAFTLAGLATKGISKITSSVDGAISRFDTMKQFPQIMQSWGYSSEDAQGSIKRLVDGIDGLPTTLDGITANVRTLVTSGLKLDDATNVALAFNNAMLANGASSADAESAMTQYSQMLAVGKVDQMAWNSVVNAAGKALNDVAEEMLGAGKNQADLYSSLKDGTITMDQFNKKMIEMSERTGGFAEQAIKGSEGVRTSMSILSSAVTRGLTNIIEAFDDAMEAQGLPNLAQSIAKLKPIIDDTFKSIASTAPFIVQKIQDIGIKGVASLALIPAFMPKVLGAIGTLGVGLGTMGSVGVSSTAKMSKGLFGYKEVIGDTVVKHKGLVGSIMNLGNKTSGVTEAMTKSAGVGVGH